MILQPALGDGSYEKASGGHVKVMGGGILLFTHPLDHHTAHLRNQLITHKHVPISCSYKILAPTHGDVHQTPF